MYNEVVRDGRINLTVLFCATREPDRHWDVPPFEFDAIFLDESYATSRGRYIHNNLDVVARLRAIRPQVVIGTSFNPTCLYAFVFACCYRCKYIAMTDGTRESERSLSVWHRRLRRVVYRFSAAFIGASDGSLELYRSYHLPLRKMFKSHLCVDNARFNADGRRSASCDLLFCGQLIDGKSPLFAFDVAERVAASLGRPVSMLIAGSGPLEAELRTRASRSTNVIATFAGFVSQSDLPGVYASARVFLFPTKQDAWGVVANEACAAGLPIVATPFAGAVGELIVDGVNGFVRSLDIAAWAAAVERLLTDESLYREFSDNSRRLVADYGYAGCASGVIDAVLAAMEE